MLPRQEPLDLSQVDEHQQDPGPLHVTKELVAQAPALGRPLDETRDIGHHELVAVEADHAQVGLEGRERVIGDLGLGGRDPGDQRALAGVREAHQSHIGHEPELEAQPALLAHLALLGEGRGPTAIGEEAGVAPTAPAAPRRQPRVPCPNQIGHNSALLVRDGDPHVGTGRSVPGPALAVRAVPGPTVGVVPKGEKGRDIAIGDQPHIAAFAAVAAIGPAPRDMRLPTERDRARATVAALHVEARLVDEAGHETRIGARRSAPGRTTRCRSVFGPCGRRT